MDTFRYLIVGVGILAALINFAIGWTNRDQRLRAVVRFGAGIVSLLLPLGIVLSQVALSLQLRPVNRDANLAVYIVIGAGLFIGATLMLPAYIERSAGESSGPTIQERAARPAKATIRLEKNSDSWVN